MLNFDAVVFDILTLTFKFDLSNLEYFEIWNLIKVPHA